MALILNKNSEPVVLDTNQTVTLVPTITPQSTDLFITKALPPQDNSQPYLTIQKVTLVFSDETEPASLKYSVDPPTEVLLRGGVDKKTIYIIPRTNWVIGKTTITILKETTSTNSKKLYRPFIYTLNSDIPPVPPGVFDVP